jgi:hypothetical protein
MGRVSSPEASDTGSESGNQTSEAPEKALRAGVGRGAAPPKFGRLGRDSAKLATMAAIGGAVIAVVGTCVGALIAGHYTSESTDRQISAESQRSTTEFLREQQKTAYGNFRSDDRNLSQQEDDFEGLLFHPSLTATPAQHPNKYNKNTFASVLPVANIQRLQSLRLQIIDTFDQLQKDDDSLQLVGSRRIPRARPVGKYSAPGIAKRLRRVC